MSSDAYATRQGFSSARTLLRACSMHHFALCGTAPGILGTEGQGNFWAPWNFGGVNSTGQCLQQEGQGHSGGWWPRPRPVKTFPTITKRCYRSKPVFLPKERLLHNTFDQDFCDNHCGPQMGKPRCCAIVFGSVYLYNPSAPCRRDTPDSLYPPMGLSIEAHPAT